MKYCQKLRKDRKDKHFLNKPVFPGGSKAMKKVVQENLKYPAEALDKKIEGTVSLKYEIDHKGNVVEGQIISGLGHGCDEEAIRIVKLFKFEVGRNRGIRTTFHKNIHIHFKLPKVKPQRKGVQYQYQQTAKKAG